MAPQLKPINPIFNPADPLAFGIVMALPCHAIGGGSVIQDVTPFAYNATVVGGVTVFADPVIGNVLQLDGTSGYVSLMASLVSALNNQAAASVSFWLRLRNNVAADAAHAGLADLSGMTGPIAASQWAMPGNIANMAIFRQFTRINNIALGGSLPFPTTGIVDKTAWHLVTITNANGGNYTVYLNGNVISQTVSPGLSSVLITPPTVGKSTDGSGTYFTDGWIGDIRVWNRELALNEVRSEYNNPWGLYTAGPPQGQMNSIFEEVEVSQGNRQATIRSVHTEVPAHQYRNAAIKSELVELEAHPAAVPTTPSGLDPRIKPSAPVLDVSNPITSGLQLAIPFFEGSGSTAQDFSGNGFNGTLVSATWATGGFRSGLFAAGPIPPLNTILFAPALKSSPGYTNVPRDIALEPAAFTIAAWCRPNANQANAGIIAKRTLLGPPGRDYSYFIGTSPAGNSFAARLTDDIDDPNLITGAARTFDGAHLYHVVFTYDPAELPSPIMRLYVDGVLDVSLPDLGNVVYDPTQDIRIGDDGSGSALFNGVIDLATIWNRALSPAEILELAGDRFNQGGMGLFCAGALSTNALVEVQATIYPHAAIKSFRAEAQVRKFRNAALRSLFVEIEADAAVSNLAGMMFNSITPHFGAQNGGTAVTIKGVNLFDINQVLVGGVPLTSLNVIDPFTITGVTGAHIPGNVDIEIDSLTRGFIIAKLVYSYTGGFGPQTASYIRGKMLDPTMPRQEPQTGLTATAGVDTILPFALTDIPQGPGSVKVYLDNSGTAAGGRLMRQGVDYDVLMGTGQIKWKSTAPIGISPSDILTVVYLAQGNT